jgi:zinc protease
MALGVVVAACAHTPAFRIASQLDLDEPFRYTLDVDAFRLSNGLTVVLAPQADANLVTVDVRYEVGAADEPAGKTGIAHFVEHLTFEGRDAAGEPVLEARLAALDYNAWTNEETTHYHATALVATWPELLRIEAARMAMTCGGIDSDLLERERGVVAQELLQRRQDVWNPLRVAVFGADSPYAHDVGGTDLASITRQDVCDFLDAHYAPDRAILVVSGAFDRKLARAAIVGRFGHPGRHGAPIAAAPPVPAGHGDFVRIVSDVDRPALLFAYARPRFGSTDAIPHQMCEWLIAQQMHQLDRDRADIVDSDVFDWGGAAAGTTLVEIVLAKNADPIRVAKAVQDKLDDMEKERTWWHVAAMHAYLDAELVGRFDDLRTRGDMIADYMQYNGDASLHVPDLQRVQKLYGDNVLAYLQDHFVEAHPVLVHLVPGGSAAPASIRTLRPTEAPDVLAEQRPVDDAEADRALAAPPPRPGRYDEIALDNGLRVIFAPRPASSTFTAQLELRSTGSPRSPTGTCGDCTTGSRAASSIPRRSPMPSATTSRPS